MRRIKGGFTKIGRSLFFIALNYIIFKKNILLVTNVTYMELLIGYRVDRKMNDEEIKEEELGNKLLPGSASISACPVSTIVIEDRKSVV